MEVITWKYLMKIKDAVFNPKKSFTLTGENINLGTDLYNEKLELVKTVPFWHNYGYVFTGPKKWHGMEEGKQIQIERRGIQLNYVTFKTDWRVKDD